MNSNTRWTPMASVMLSTFVLGLSCWAVACGSTSTPPTGPALPATAPSAAIVAPGAMDSKASRADQVLSDAGAAQPIATTTAVGAPNVKTQALGKGTRTEKEVTGNAQMRIKRLVVARGVKGREPVDALTEVAAGNDQLYAFIEVENRSVDDGSIVITFEKSGTRTGNIELKVPANQDRWRTWGWTRGVRESGQWAVVVRSVGGRELARTAFQVS